MHKNQSEARGLYRLGLPMAVAKDAGSIDFVDLHDFSDALHQKGWAGPEIAADGLDVSISPKTVRLKSTEPRELFRRQKGQIQVFVGWVQENSAIRVTEVSALPRSVRSEAVRGYRSTSTPPPPETYRKQSITNTANVMEAVGHCAPSNAGAP